MHSRAIIAVAALLALCESSRAGLQFTWNGAGADALWTNPDNWVGNNEPPFNVGGNDIIFGSTGGVAQSPDIDGNDYTQISSIAYLGADAALTLVDVAGGGSLSFVNGGSLTNNSAFLQTIDVDIVGTFDSLIITSIGGGDFDIFGDIDLSHTGGVELTVGGVFDTLLGGVISGDGGSLRKISDGVLTITGANTFDGGVELAGGVIVLGDDAALGTGDLVVTGDAALRSDDDLRAIDNDVSIADAVTLAFTGGNDLALDGDISGDGSLLVDADTDDTALTLGGDNTYTGGTTLMRGTIVLGSDDALGEEVLGIAGDGSIQSDDDARVIGNRIRIDEDVTLTFSGTNDLELSERIFNLGSLTVNAGADDATLALTGANTYSGGTTLMRGTVLLGSNNALGSGEVTVAGDSSIQSDANNRRINNAIDIADTVHLTFSGSADLELRGVISGDGGMIVDADGGNDRLILSGANEYTGGTLLNRGTITIGNNTALGTGDLTLGSDAVRLRSTNDNLAIDNAIDTNAFLLTFAGNQGLTINGDITGAGGLLMNGVDDTTLTLTGANTYTGDTTVDGGVLLLGGDSASITSDVLVNDGGTFGGSGSVTGDLTVAGGATVTPGIGVGTLVLDGDYLQESDATFTVDLDSLDLTSFDMIDATGTATLEDGARINASISGDGYIPSGQLFEILQADGGITQAGDVIINLDSATVTVDLVRDQGFMNNDVAWSLQLARAANAYSAAADPGNNQAIGAGLDSLIGVADLDPAGNAGDLLGVLDTLPQDEYNSVVAQLSPQPYWVDTASGLVNVRDFTTEQAAYLTGARMGMDTPPAPPPVVTSMAMLASNDPLLLATAMAQHEQAPDPAAAPPPAKELRWGRYIKLQGVFVNQDTTSDRIGYSGQGFGGQLGIDYSFTTDFLAGLAIGYTYTTNDVDQNLGTLDDHALRFGPYMSYASGNWYVDGSATAAYHLYRGDRNIPLLASVAESDYDGWDATGYVGTGYHFNPAWNLHVTPMGSLLYTHFEFSEFTETGASGANLTLPDRSDDSLRSRLGVNVSYAIPNLGWQPIVYGYCGWEHEFLDNNDLEATFAAGGNPFIINLGTRDRDAIFYGGGVNLLVNDAVALFFRIEALTADTGNAVGAAGGLSVAF